jgi:hypothetical protein
MYEVELLTYYAKASQVVPPETPVERYKHLMLVILEHLGYQDDLEQKVYENHFDSRWKIIVVINSLVFGFVEMLHFLNFLIFIEITIK